VQSLGGDVTVAVLEQKLCQGQTLTRRPQLRGAQAIENPAEWSLAGHLRVSSSFRSKTARLETEFYKFTTIAAQIIVAPVIV